MPGTSGGRGTGEKFYAAVLTASGTLHHQNFKPTAGGLAVLRRWLRALQVQVAAAVMEATDFYFERPAQRLMPRACACIGQPRASQTLCPGAAHPRLAPHLRVYPESQRQSELLVSIPGVGAATTALLLAELTHLPADVGRRALAAYAEFNPTQNQRA